MCRFRCFFIVTFVSLVLSSTFTWALSVKPLTLGQIVSLSSLIFRGQVTQVKRQLDAEESHFWVDYVTFQVKECFKGGCWYPTQTIKQTAQVKGLPQFSKGDEVLVFLPSPAEESGLLAPTGIWQGVYPLHVEAGGTKISFLMDRPVLKVVSVSALKKNELENLKPNQLGNDYAVFRQAVKKILGEK